MGFFRVRSLRGINTFIFSFVHTFIKCLSTRVITSVTQSAKIPIIILLPAFAIANVCPQVLMAQNPNWDTFSSNPAFHNPGHPIVFVAAYRHTATDQNGKLIYGNGGNFGTDVLQIPSPSRGNELWIMLTDGSTKKLFPYPSLSRHEDIVDYPIGPSEGRINGTVMEPSISLDGEHVFFTYIHDAKNCPSGYICPETAGYQFAGWPKGGDIYVIKLTELLNNSNFDPRNLTIKRLTHQSPDKYEEAMNPDVAHNTTIYPQESSLIPGNFYVGAQEIADRNRSKLVFASNMLRLKNSNFAQLATNYNFAIFEADFDKATLSIKNIRRSHTYLTTSAVSPERIGKFGDEYAFSLQGNKEQARNWDYHSSTIKGKWAPLMGYGKGTDLVHLGTYCVKSRGGSMPTGEYFLGTHYYNANNNGFGYIAAQNISKAGLNTYDNPAGHIGFSPQQVGSHVITIGVAKGDFPSSVGKFTTPACGEPDNLFLAYSPTPSNSANLNQDLYPSYIVHTEVEPFNLVTNSSAMVPVIKSKGANSQSWASIWAKPVIPWYQRTGMPPTTQAPRTTIIDKNVPIMPGEPYAIVGTSALYNTDVTPPDCRLSTNIYNPQAESEVIHDAITDNIDGLTRVENFAQGNPTNMNGVCSPIQPAHIFGIAIYETSNKTNLKAAGGNTAGYVTDGTDTVANVYNSDPKEAKRLLGIYSTVNKPDTSFKALIPADTSVSFQLLAAKYALKLADLRGWHSFKPREFRADCGGCHNHKEGEGVPWEGTYSASPQVPPVDFVNQTPTIMYDESCNPSVVNLPITTKSVPSWQDISPGFAQHCGTCHANGSGNTTALTAFDYNANEINSTTGNSPVTKLFNRKYINKKFGALSSPAFWAARGERTDGRPNNLPAYQPNYSQGVWGFKYSSVHNSIGPRGNGLCDGDRANGSTAQWVYEFGKWMDNHSPQNTGQPYPVHFDQFHPTVDIALTDQSCGSATVRVGYWDDTGLIKKVTVKEGGAIRQVIQNNSSPNSGLSNGSYEFNLNTVVSELNLEVEVVDLSGNRFKIAKNGLELLDDCYETNDIDPPDDNITDNLFINLTTTPGTYFPGDEITLQVRAPTQNTVSIICSTKSGLTPLEGGTISLIDNNLFKWSSENFTIPTSSGYGTITLKIPPIFNPKKKEILCQAISSSNSSTLTSSVLKLPIATPGKKKMKKIKAKAAKVKAKALIKIAKLKIKRKIVNKALKQCQASSPPAQCTTIANKKEALTFKIKKLNLKKQGLLLEKI